MKPVLLGQGPSRTGASGEPFRGRSGQRLADLAGLTLDEFLDRVEAANLLTEFHGKQRNGKGDLFPRRRAERAAKALLPLLRGRLILAAGKEVAAALGASPTYFEERIMGSCLIVTIPHPSGVNRWWNLAENRRRAERELRRLLGRKKQKIPGGRPGIGGGDQDALS